MSIRVGSGIDVHAFGPGDHVMLGGVRIAHSQGVQAHSDGDVLLHALCDALIDKLNRHPALDAARKQVERLKRTPYADLSGEDKQALLTLTREIRTLSGRH
mgnify:CR=1 FL=1